MHFRLTYLHQERQREGQYQRPRIERARADFAAATAMVDPERLARLLRRTTDDPARLRPWAGERSAALLADEVSLDHVKYRFVTAIEAVIDAAHHRQRRCGGQRTGPPNAAASPRS